MENKGATEPSSWEGEHYVPQAGLEAVQEFQGLWPSLVDVVSKALDDIFGIRDGVLGAMRENAAPQVGGSVVCTVSDPSSQDCSLVFVSKTFEQMTGYDCSFALGRNCRFLQPNHAELNKAVNGEELQRMRKFVKANLAPGSSMINLLLNETRTGERFWNLLHLLFVEVNDKLYILGVQTVLELPMPSVLRNRPNSGDLDGSRGSNELALLTAFSTELGQFLQNLRNEVASYKHLTSSSKIADVSRLASDSITGYLKANCDDFEGDHWVPRQRMQNGRKIDGRDLSWDNLINSVGSLLSSLWGISVSAGECVACAVSDPSLEDCPLVYISKQFEVLTGYGREWVIGRNCRFLQPKLKTANDRLNGEECKRMRDFSKEPKVSGSRMVNLLVNESISRQPFWNLLLMEHIEINGKPYIFGIHTNLEYETERLAELLVHGPGSNAELQRLRKIFRSKEDKLGTRADMNSAAFTVQQLVTECIDQWLETYPASMGLPRLQVCCGMNRARLGRSDIVGGAGLTRKSSLTNCARVAARTGHSMYIPTAGLMIDADSIHELPKALSNGIRHFYLMMIPKRPIVSGGKGVDAPPPPRDADEKNARIFIMQVSDALSHLKKGHYNWLQDAIAFTVVTSANTCACFDELRKVIVFPGYRLFGWLLDVKDISKNDFSNCWKQMAVAHAAGDVCALGLKGGGPNTLASWEKASDGVNVPLSIWAVDIYPGKIMEPLAESKLKHMIDNLKSTLFLCHNIFGPREQLLRDDDIKCAAKAVDVDPPTYIVKWAEAQNLGVMLPANYFMQSQRKEQKFDRTYVVEYTRAASAITCLLHHVDQIGGVGVVRKDLFTQENYLRACKGQQTLQTTQMITEQFGILDTDGDGSVSRSEFESVFRKMGMDELEVEILFQDFDNNRDGRISFSEFSAHIFGEDNRVSGKPAAQTRRASLPPVQRRLSSARTEPLPRIRRPSLARLDTTSGTIKNDISSHVTRKFKEMDGDSNGLVSLEEFEQVFRSLGLSDADVETLFSGVDVDGDGQISLSEFSDYVFGKQRPQSEKVDDRLVGS